MIGVFSVYRQKKIIPAGKMAEVLELAVVRAGSTCKCCNITIPKSAGLVFLDSNPNNINAENVVAVCKICEALHSGGRLNADSEYGVLIYLPQLSQVDIIRMAHALYNLIRMGEHIPQLSELKAQMRKLEQVAVQLVGSSDTDGVSDIFLNMKEGAYMKRHLAIGGLRFWPDIEVFRKYLIDYQSSFLGKDDLDEFIKKII